MEIKDFGVLPTTGKQIKLFTLTNKNKVEVMVTEYGATLVGLRCSDRNGTFDDILLGFDNIQGYLDNSYFGSTIGRFANRIYKGQFTLDEKKYALSCNNGDNHLHGGDVGFDKKVWKWAAIKNGIEFSLISDDGDEGYPGKLHIACTYVLSDDNELEIMMKAHLIDGEATLVNLTNHAFINLAGQNNFNPILDHILEINAERYTPHKDFVMTGEILDVDHKFDFTQPKAIGRHINEVVGGYDHNYCLINGKSLCARVYHEKSGRQLEIFTSQPGVQFYTGNFLNTTGKAGNKYSKHTGFCLEPQSYPDNINQPAFPSSILRNGEEYEQTITWKLSTK